MRAVVSKEPVATSRLPGLLLTGSVLTLSAIASWASRSKAGVGPGCLLGWGPLFSCQTGCLSEEPDCGESRVVRLGRPWVVMLRRHPHFSLQLRTRLALGGPCPCDFLLAESAFNPHQPVTCHAPREAPRSPDVSPTGHVSAPEQRLTHGAGAHGEVRVGRGGEGLSAARGASRGVFCALPVQSVCIWWSSELALMLRSSR